jgi:hypothetical protein
MAALPHLATLFLADRLLFLICSIDRLALVRVRDRRKPAMECTQCGGLMMLEAMIKLWRSFLGFRETRSRGAYRATCKIGVPRSPSRHPSAGLDHGAVPQEHQGFCYPGDLPACLDRVVAIRVRCRWAIRFPWRGRRSRTPVWMPSRHHRSTAASPRAEATRYGDGDGTALI